jgi:predicted nucleic acid-binding protein
MGPFVVDASLTLSWCFVDEATPYSRGILAALKTSYAVAPALWPFEVANALAVADRRQRITQEGIEGFLDTLRRLPIQIERREALWLWQAVLPVAREHRLSAYDAAYLELAKREGMHLATLDHDLERAARTLGIPILEVS